MEKTQTMCNSIDKNGNCTHFKIADIEIWIEYENEVYVFYLFDYERGVINFN